MDMTQPAPMDDKSNAGDSDGEASEAEKSAVTSSKANRKAVPKTRKKRGVVEFIDVGLHL